MIFYLNLDRCPERDTNFRSSFARVFSGAPVTRIQGMDGLLLSDGSSDSMGRVQWGRAVPDAVHPQSSVTPTQYACAEGHLSMWKAALAGPRAPRYYFFEDDAELSQESFAPKLLDIVVSDEVPENFLCLVGAGSDDKVRCRIDDNRRIVGLRTLAAYTMSHEMTEYVVRYLEGLKHRWVYPVDKQLSYLFFRRMRREAVLTQLRKPGRFPAQLPVTFDARGLAGVGFVKLGSMSEQSCMTFDGAKPWED